MLGIRQWSHGAFCVSRQHRLRRVFIFCESKFTISESRTISHANDTQAQQVTPNPRPGRFSTETPLERERRLQIQREQRRRKSQQETAEQKELRLAQRRQRRQQDRGTGDWNQKHYDRSLSKTHPRRYMWIKVCKVSALYDGPNYNNFQANFAGPDLFFVLAFF